MNVFLNYVKYENSIIILESSYSAVDFYYKLGFEDLNNYDKQKQYSKT